MGKIDLIYKLLLIAVAATIIDIFLFWAIIQPKSELGINNDRGVELDKENKNFDGNNPTDNVQNLNVQIAANTDKKIYSSYEQIILSIKLTGDQDLDNVLISAEGINDRLNRNYFNKNQTINLAKSKTAEIIFTQTLPSCNSCSGLSPGNYSITVSAVYQDTIIATKKINLTIKQ